MPCQSVLLLVKILRLWVMGASMSKGGPGVLQISRAMKSAGDFLGDFTYNRPAHVTGHQSGGTSNRDLTCIRRDTGGL